MDRAKIVSARVEIGDEGFDLVVAEAEFATDGGEKLFVSLAEVDGYPNLYRTENSTIHLHLNPAGTEEEFEDLQRYYVSLNDYDEIFENPDDEYYGAYRYLVYLVRSDNEDTEKFIAETCGKYLQEIDIPVSDVEEDYIERHA